MLKTSSLLLMVGIIGMVFLTLSPMALAEENGMLFSVNTLSEFDVDEQPFIYGTATDTTGNPLQYVEIQANFPSRAIIATTDSAGEFSIKYPVTAELGEHAVTVYATKGSLYLSAQVTYQVIDKQQVAKSNDSENKSDSHDNSSKISRYDNSKYDLFSRMIIDKIEDQKIENAKKEVLSKEQQAINNQRIQMQTDLEEDIKAFENQNEFYKPRNAFLRFLTDIDHSVKNIFWNQFLFTEKKTDDARIAKENALEEGKTTIEATKIFQKEAAISQKEIIEYNNELSITYGNATSSVQEQFDKNGKIPRD